MVTDLRGIPKILRILEAYFIKKNGFKLKGHTYDLILLLPAESSGYIKFSWMISSKLFNALPQTSIINEILVLMKESLNAEEYSAISRINVINSNHPFVRNVNFIVPGEDEMVQFNNQVVGGVDLNQAILIKSRIHKMVKENNAIVFTLNDGKKVPAGVIAIDSKFRIKHYTGKGLREIFGDHLENFDKVKAKELKAKSENYLITNKYISYTSLFDIKGINL